MPQDRLARDVAFYIDAFPDGALTAKELRTWNQHIPVRAVRTFGLSDDKHIDVAAALKNELSDIAAPQFDSDVLTEPERKCPLRIRQPDRTPIGTR